MKSLGHKIHVNFPGGQHVLETFTTFAFTYCVQLVLYRVSETHAEFQSSNIFKPLFCAKN